MPTAEQIYTDPSALIPLYLHQPRSREVVAWRARLGGTLVVTHHGRAEIVNAIGLAAFRGEISVAQATDAWEALDQDFLDGHLAQVPLAWRAALKRAVELSRSHTPRLGTRAADVLHVACAQELGLPCFMTLDDRQGKLVAAAGLRVLRL